MHYNFAKSLSHVCSGRRTESKPVSLTKHHDPKQNHSSPANGSK